MKSPFETLGFLPSLVGRLSEDQLTELVKDSAKALQFVYHPDKRGGDDFKSVVINQAVAALGTPSTVRDAKKEYVESGPGQKEIDEAETELLALQAKLHALKENMMKTTRFPSDRLSENEEFSKKNTLWLEALYPTGPDCGEVPLESQDPKDLQEDTSRDLGATRAFQLANTPGMTFELATDIGLHMDLKTELKELREADKEHRVKEDEEIELLEYGIKEESRCVKRAKTQTVRERHQKEVEKEQRLLADMKAERAQRTQKIKDLKEQIKRAGRELRKKGEITESGHILLEGNPTGLRVVGSADADGAFIGGIALEPLLAKGRFMYGADSSGKLKNLGVIQQLEESGSRKAEEKPLGIENADEVAVKPDARGKKARKAVRMRKAEPVELPHEQEVHFEQTALTIRKGIRFVYAKSPFETIGLLPSLVAELGSEDLKTFIKFISRSLKRAFHPDSGGDSADFATLMGALDALEKPEVFDRARAEYAASKPGQGAVAAIDKEAETLRNRIRESVQELGRAKVEASHQNSERRTKAAALERYLKLVVASLYREGAAPEGRKDALFLHKSEGAVLSVDMDGAPASLAMEMRGFSAYAVCKKPETRMLLLGSTPPDMFKSLAEASAAVEMSRISETYGDVHPVLYEKGYLVAVEDGSPKTVGMIENIDQSNLRAKQADAARADMKDSIERGKELAEKLKRRAKSAGSGPETKKKQPL